MLWRYVEAPADSSDSLCESIRGGEEFIIASIEPLSPFCFLMEAKPVLRRDAQA